MSDDQKRLDNQSDEKLKTGKQKTRVDRWEMIKKQKVVETDGKPTGGI